MKRVVSIFAAVVFWIFVASVAHAETTESISSFRSVISIQKSGTMRVQETILYDFGTLYRHGIFRDIPYTYDNKGTTYTLRISPVSVTDEKNVAYHYTTSKTNGNVEIKIGDPDTTINGLHTYVITYDVERAITTFSDHQELYWNVTGNSWTVPIDKASTTVTLEGGASDFTDVICFTGTKTSKDQQCEAKIDGGTVSVASTTPLSAAQGLTAVVSIKQGTVAIPSTLKSVGWFIQDNGIAILPLIVWAILHFYWFKHGRDPKLKTAIIPQYESPRGLTPGEVGAVWDNKVDPKDISASVISLAVKGYIKIKALEKKNYQFIKLQKDPRALSKFEKNLLSSLFLDVPTLTSVELKDLKDKFYKNIKSLQNDLYATLVEKGLYAQNPNSLRNTFYGIAGVCLFFSFFFSSSPWFILVFMLCTVLFFVYGSLMPQRTVEGAHVKREIEGFKWFLSVTETERLKFHNAPAKKPEQFQELLPYAMALGVEKEWAKQFEGITMSTPGWYEGDMTTFNAIYFAAVLSSMNSSMASGFTSRPGGTSSGFGGGGFSGGGFGGGGGGSW